MRAVVTALLALLTACAATPPPPANAPTNATEPTTLGTTPTQTKTPKATASEVPKPPEACAAYLQAPIGCDSSRPFLERLADALAESESLTRDRKLACVEPEQPELSALLRALRADVAPVACADALVVPLLENTVKPQSPEDENVLVGLMLAAKLSRLVGSPPTLEPPFDKARFLEFFKQTLTPWIVGQALAIGDLSREGAKLHGYGKAVAAIEAGLADLRFVQIARKVALPAEIDSDAEMRNAYYVALDEALEPRKARGRDAALVGLRIFSELGAVHDARVEQARRLLAELYGGSRIDALDRLLLPELPALHADGVEQKLAARLPTYYALRIIPEPKQAADAKLLRAFAERGLPVNWRAKLDTENLSPEAKFVYASLEARRGVVYFSAQAFAHAAALLPQTNSDPASALVAAVGHALEAAPQDAAGMMLTSPRLTPPLGSLAALNALAAKKARYGAEAEFDAAYVSELAPPENDSKFWSALAERYTRAAKGLRSEPERSRAREHAEGARKTAAAIQSAQQPAPTPAK